MMLRRTLLSPVLVAIGVALAAGNAAPALSAPAVHARPKGVDLKALFKLTTHEGRRLEQAELKGKPVILFFGYTNCPEVCPTSLMDMTLYLQGLGADADRVRVLFVTADPERDTVETLDLYLSNFDSRITGLTGRLEHVQALVEALGASLLQGDKSDDYYSVDHAASTFMFDKYGLLSQMVPFGDDEGLADYSKRLLAQ